MLSVGCFWGDSRAWPSAALGKGNSDTVDEAVVVVRSLRVEVGPELGEPPDRTGGVTSPDSEGLGMLLDLIGKNLKGRQGRRERKAPERQLMAKDIMVGV